MNNALMVVGAALIAVLAALFAVPYFIDWNGYRGVFEEEASRVLGRDVRVGGKVNLRLLPSPYVRFERVRIADTTGITGEPIFRAEAFTMWLSVPPLLKGVFEARQVELKKPVLTVAVDKDGRGSWSGLKLTTGSLPFVPANVTLQSMRISDGVITLQRAGGSTLAEVTDIAGEVESDAVQGPYRFKGTVHWQGGEREIKLATAPPDADGGIRFKTIIRVPASANSYTLEGRLDEPMTRPRIEGDLTAKIGLSLGEPAEAKGAKPAKAAERPGLDLKLHIRADGTGAKLTDIAGSLENVGQPQLVSGNGELSWVLGVRMATKLESRWLDLDRLTSSGKDGAPLETALALADDLMHGLPTDVSSSLTLAVDQVNLGGEAVAGLVLSASRSDGPLKLDTLKASLPGGARLALAGTIEGGADHRRFAGTISLRGPSFGRFVNWAARDQGLIASRHDGPFALHGGLGFSRKAVDLTGASAEIAGSNITGDVHYSAAERERLSLSIAGPRIDAGALWSLARRSPALAALEAGGATGQVAGAKTAAKVPTADMVLQIRAGQLTSGDDEWRDVDADVAVHDGAITVRKLAAKTANGAEFVVTGEVTDVEKRPRGTLRWQLGATSAQAMATLARQGGARLAERLAELSPPDSLFPLRLAGALDLGQRGEQSGDVTLDGVAGKNSGRISAAIKMDHGIEAWRTSPLDLSLSSETVDNETAMFLLGGRGGEPAAGAASRQQDAPKGRLVVKAAGTPDKAITVLASLEADGQSLVYEGRAAMAAGAARRLDGYATVSAWDLRALLGLAGVQLGEAVGAVTVNGGVAVASEGDQLKLSARGLSIAGQPLDGTASIVARSDGKPLQVTADLRAGAVSLQRLASVVLDERSPAGTAGAADGVWPEKAFDLSPLERIEGEIQVRFPTLSVAKGLALTNARMVARLKPGRLEIAELTGDGLGANTRARAVIERQMAGVRVTGEVEMEPMDLARLGADGDRHRATGTLAWKLTYAGRALSPAALVAGLEGKGKIEIGRETSLAGFAAQPVAAAAEKIVTGKADITGEELISALSEALNAGKLKLGPRTLDFEVAGGAVRVPAIAVDMADGRTTLVSTIDLGSLKIDNEVRVEAKVVRRRYDGSQPTPLPPLTVAYVGGLGNLRSLEPRIAVGALERELVVRRMERNVEELERLRREDEERARQEKERQRLAEEKARAEAEAKARLEAEAAAAASAAPTRQQPVADERSWLTRPAEPAGGEATPSAESTPGPTHRPWLTSPPVPAPADDNAVVAPGGQAAVPGAAPEAATANAEAARSATPAAAKPQPNRSGLSQAEPQRAVRQPKSSPSDLIMRQFQGTPN